MLLHNGPFYPIRIEKMNHFRSKSSSFPTSNFSEWFQNNLNTHFRSNLAVFDSKPVEIQALNSQFFDQSRPKLWLISYQ